MWVSASTFKPRGYIYSDTITIEDLNNINTSGIYYVTGTEKDTVLPLKNWGILMVYSYAAKVQILIYANPTPWATRMYIRGASGSPLIWTDWNLVLTSLN